MKKYRFLIYTIIATLLGYGLWMELQDIPASAISEVVARVGWPLILGICLLSIVNYTLRYVRWYWLLGQLGERMTVIDGALCYLAGFALTTTPGKAGETIRCLYFKRRHQVSHPHTLAALLAERASDAFSGLVLAFAVLYTFDSYRYIGVAVFLLMFAIIIFINQPSLVLRITALLQRINLDFFRRFVDGIPHFIQHSSSLFAPGILFPSIGIGLVSWSAEAIAFAWLIQAMGHDISTLLLMSIFAVSMIGGAISFLPGGVGAAEGIMAGLLILVGLSGAEALAATLICRLTTLWFAVIIGVGALTWLEHQPQTTQQE